MRKIRLRVTVLVSWLVFFSLLGRVLSPIEISTITFGLVIGIVAAGLIASRLTAVQISALTIISITTLLVTKAARGEISSYLAIVLTVIEVCVVLITIILSIWVNFALNELEKAVANITLGPREKRLESTTSGHGSIYREVRRARNHQRPLAVISIGVDENSIKPAAERIVQEIQLSMMKEYKLRELSKLLCDQLEDCAVIVQDSDFYLAVLPDTLPEEIPIVVERLRQKACVEVGVDIKIGVATLPADGYTFEGLVERANQIMKNDREPQPCAVVDQYPMERRTIQ